MVALNVAIAYTALQLAFPKEMLFVIAVLRCCI